MGVITMSKVDESQKRLISLLPLKVRQVEFSGKMAKLHKAVLHSFVEKASSKR
jgi:hypothetical protein